MSSPQFQGVTLENVFDTVGQTNILMHNSMLYTQTHTNFYTL